MIDSFKFSRKSYCTSKYSNSELNVKIMLNLTEGTQTTQFATMKIRDSYSDKANCSNCKGALRHTFVEITTPQQNHSTSFHYNNLPRSISPISTSHEPRNSKQGGEATHLSGNFHQGRQSINTPWLISPKTFLSW